MTDHNADPDGVRQAYDEWSRNYDTAPNKTRDLDERHTRQRLHLGEGKDIVELGCGTGKNTALWATVAHTVLAVDASSGMLARARKKVDADHVEFRQLDLLGDWAIPPKSADLVVVHLVLEHIEDLAAIFTRIAQTLRDGGRLLISELHPYRQLQGSGARYEDEETGEEVRVASYLHDVSEYVGAAQQAGYSLVSIDELRDPEAAKHDVPRLLAMEFVAG